MPSTAPAASLLRRARPSAVVVLLAAALVAVVLHPPVSVSALRELPPIGASRAGADAATGVLPGGVTAFDERHEGVTRLDPALLTALRRAAADAEEDGVAIEVNSGWRSAAYQQRLLDEAVAEHGSVREAARWVATPETSPHVSGDAVDVGDLDAMSWLSGSGAAYGLCQVYGNEPWHFELRPEAPSNGCPPTYADPSHDPRLGR